MWVVTLRVRNVGHNQLLRIEEELGAAARYAGWQNFRQ
jgi:hypothetical protein